MWNEFRKAIIIILMEDAEIFNVLTESEKIILKNNLIKETAGRKQSIYSQNNDNKYIYYLINGKIKFGKYLVNSQEIITGIVYPNSFFGIKSIANGHSGSEYAEALTDVSYLKIRSDIIKEFMQKNSSFSKKINDEIFNYISKIETWLELMHYSQSIKERLIRFFIEFAKESGYKVGNETVIKIDLTQREIGDFIFASRQTISEIMNQLKQENLIYYDRSKILIRDIDKLKRIQFD
jgi:CRP-like cAMP-binding protein